MKCAKEMSNLIHETKALLLLDAAKNTTKLVTNITDEFAFQITKSLDFSNSYSFYIGQISRSDDPNFINRINTKNGYPNGWCSTLYNYAALIDILTNLHYSITIEENAITYLSRKLTKITISIPSSLPCD